MEIVYYPDPRLREVAKPIEKIDDKVKEVAKEMFNVMYENRGIGLAGPQVGFGYRVVVANLIGKPDGEKVFINPEIIKKSGKVEGEEGCLSLPGIVAVLKRAEKVIVDVTSLDGKRERMEADGLYAKLFQHEIDHLDGILIVDKMSSAEKKLYADKIFELEDDFKQNRKRKHKVLQTTPL